MYAAALVLALLALSACSTAAPNGGRLTAQTSSPQAVVGAAREIALATVREVEAAPKTRVRAFAAMPAYTRLVAGDRQRVQSILHSVMSQPDSGYVTRSAAAYSLYLLDAAQVDTVVEVLVTQMNQMAFADFRVAELLLIAIGPPAVPGLLRHAGNSMVLSVLGAMGVDAREAVPRLRDLVGTRNVEVAATLAAIGTPEAIAVAKPVLVAALRESHAHDAHMALGALGGLGPRARDAAPGIRHLLEHGNPETRLYAALALADVGDTQPAVAALGDLLDEQELHNRFPAIQRLGLLGGRARPAVPQLLALLGDATRPDGERADVAVALTKIDPGNATVRAAVRQAASRAAMRALIEERGAAIPPR